MDPVITIETVPISIEYVERESWHSAARTARLRLTGQDGSVSVRSHPIRLPSIDTFEPSASGGRRSFSYTASARYADDGRLEMSVRLENRTGNEYLFRQSGRDIENMMDFLPSSAGGACCIPQDAMRIRFDLNALPSRPAEIRFTPPDLVMKVVEQPKVIIKYVGGPIYIPRSADPDYVEPEPVNQIFDGKPALDVKA